MINHLTGGQLGAGTRTRILTFGLHTGTIRCTVRVQNAFRSATLIRIAHILGQTHTRAGAVLFATQRIRTAWTRHARRQRRVLHDRRQLHGTMAERIADVAGRTDAHGGVRDDATFSVGAAHARTRIDALVANARHVVGTFGVRCALRPAVWWTADERGKARA